MTSNFNDTIELAYTTKEVSQKIGIASPTVRKYGQILEKAGYTFLKNGDRRVFVESDIEALKEMKKSENIEKTALDLMRKQKEKNDITNDTKEAISSISPPDTILSQREKMNEIALYEKRYNQLLSAFEKMSFEYAATRELIEDNTNKVEQLLIKYEEEQEEKRLFKEKLDIAVEYIQKQEQQQDPHQEKTEKKSIWKRLFG